MPARLKGKSISEIAPQCSVLFTSEYNICTGSDAARVLTVNMNHVDDKGLEYFQDRPLIVSTFYHHFVKWFVNHYDAVVDKFKKRMRQAAKHNVDFTSGCSKQFTFCTPHMIYSSDTASKTN